VDIAPVSATIGTAHTPVGPHDRDAPVTKEQVEKVAQQFEAIIVRQLLKPAIDPIMGGNSMGKGATVGGGGGAVYGHLLTDVLSGTLADSGQLGFAKLLQHQLTPEALKAVYQKAEATGAFQGEPISKTS
jgi:flagellar protein FlgJ